MTDKTQPEALRLALSIDLMDTFTNYQQEELNKAAAELRRQHARIAELEAEIAAVGAGGVQALSAAPAGWKLVPEDATEEMVRATDKVNFANADTDGTMHNVWNVMLAASPTPPAEQQAQPGAVYAELPEPTTHQIAELKACEHGDAIVGWRVEPSRQSFHASMHPKRTLYTTEQARNFADRTHALRMQQAVPEAAPSEGGDETDWYHGMTEKHFDKAVQKAIQRDRASRAAAPKAAPVVWLSSKQLRGVTALHGQYLPFRHQPEGRFDTPVYLEQAAPKAAPGEQQNCGRCCGSGEDPAGYYDQSRGDAGVTFDGPCRECNGTGAAPQQEAQERVYLVNTGEVRNGLEMYERHDKFVPLADCEVLYTAPQPAPAPLSDDVLKKAARYDFLRDCDLDDMAAKYWPGGEVPTGQTFDAAIDAALAAQGGKV